MLSGGVEQAFQTRNTTKTVRNLIKQIKQKIISVGRTEEETCKSDSSTYVQGRPRPPR